MCFRGFIYFACGHNKIVETECDHIKGLEVPLYNKTNCPNYNQQAQRPPFKCGGGRFYCTNDRDAPFFEHLWGVRVLSLQQITAYNIKLNELQRVADGFVQDATRRGVARDQWAAHPVFQRIQGASQELTLRRAASQKNLDQANQILTQGQKYYANLPNLRAAANGNVTPPFAPGPSTMNKVPMEEQQQLPPQPRQGSETGVAEDLSEEVQTGTPNTDQQARTNTRPASKMPTPSPAKPANEAGQRPDSAQATPSNFDDDPSLSPHERAKRAAQRASVNMSPNMTPRKYFANRRGKGQKPATEPKPAKEPKPAQQPRKRKLAPAETDNASEDGDVVRRSARVRGRQVNYAESQGSESPESSPLKSDVSGFTPGRSEQNSSPEKGRRGRRGRRQDLEQEGRGQPRLAGSLGDMMREYNQRGGPTGSVTPVQRDSMRVRDTLNPRQGQPTSARSNVISTPSLASMQAPTGFATPVMQSSDLQRRPPMTSNSPWHSGNQPPQQSSMMPPSQPTYPRMSPQLAFGTQQQPMQSPGPDGRYTSEYTQVRLPIFAAQWHSEGSPYEQMAMPSNPFHQGLGQFGPGALQSNMMGAYGAASGPPFNNPMQQHMPSVAPPIQQARRDSGLSSAPGISQPTYGSMLPAYGNTQPAYGNAQPVYGNTQPAYGNTQPAYGNTQPAYGDTQPAYGTQTPVSNNYEQMQRRFSSSAPGLTPSSTSQYGMPNTEPTKRTQNISSPMPPPAKRMRLSLPGELPSNDRSTQQGGMTEGAKESAPPLPGSDPIIAGGGGSDDIFGPNELTTPAPIFAPAEQAARMQAARHQSSQSFNTDREGETAAGSELFQDVFGVHEDANENERLGGTGLQGSEGVVWDNSSD